MEPWLTPWATRWLGEPICAPERFRCEVMTMAAQNRYSEEYCLQMAMARECPHLPRADRFRARTCSPHGGHLEYLLRNSSPRELRRLRPA